MLIAACVTAAISSIRERLYVEADEAALHKVALQLLDQVFVFLRGGLDALRNDP